MADISAYIENFKPSTAGAVFVAYALIDSLYAYYTICVTRGKAGRAATAGAAIYVPLAIGVILYVRNPAYVAPMAMGSWPGTFVTVKASFRIANQN